MILSDSKIKERIRELLDDFDDRRARHCGYELRLGKFFLTETGEQTTASSVDIKPSETLVVETQETVKIPIDLCATYGQLNRLARQGLMVLNTSLVEPGYQGPLTCVLVNFSRQPIGVCLGDPIAKIYFHQVHGVPTERLQAVSRVEYERQLFRNALQLPKSFLDISGMEDRVAQKMRTVVRNGVILSGMVIGMLLLWSQLEPLFSEWIWKRTGLASNTVQRQMDLERVNLESRHEILTLEEKNTALESKLKDLERLVEQTRKNR